MHDGNHDEVKGGNNANHQCIVVFIVINPPLIPLNTRLMDDFVSVHFEVLLSGLFIRF